MCTDIDLKKMYMYVHVCVHVCMCIHRVAIYTYIHVCCLRPSCGFSKQDRDIFFPLSQRLEPLNIIVHNIQRQSPSVLVSMK